MSSMFIKIILFPFFIVGLITIIITVLYLLGTGLNGLKFLYKKFVSFNQKAQFGILLLLTLFLLSSCQEISENKKKEALMNRNANQIVNDCERCQIEKYDCTQECWTW